MPPPPRAIAIAAAAAAAAAVLLLLSWTAPAAAAAAGPGRWELLLENAGIASMHSAVTHYGNVVFLDRTDIGPSQINLTGGACRDSPADLTLAHDCTAHSVVFTPGPPAPSVRPLLVSSDTWCSSGQFFPDGTLVHTGGDNDGLSKVRRFAPCPSDATCDWVEDPDVGLQDGRWYASNQLLPDGRQIVVGGRSVFTYEFVPREPGESKVFLPFLNATNDAQNDNYYPFLHLLPDGTLYIFANRDSIVYDYRTHTVVKALPTIPGEPRNYPSAGSSVLLPLSAADGGGGFASAEVLVCGGAQLYCFLYPAASPNASQTCGRISVTAERPEWAMETMPVRRAMGDMLLLPTGDVLLINGAQNGCQGWGNARNPALSPVLYRPRAAPGERFATLAASAIPRVYHSTANLLPDGRVLVAGSNTHQFYTFAGEFPTELRVEAFVPDYGGGDGDAGRPAIVSAPGTIVYAQPFAVQVATAAPTGAIAVSLISSPFTTHSFSQGLRLLELAVHGVAPDAGNATVYSVNATAPPSPTVAPPAYYMLWVLSDGVPCREAAWVRITYSTTT